MTIEPCNPEIIGLENFIPTELENLFINRDENTAVIIDGESAVKIATK
jgi:hypothetical protein